MTGAGGSRDTRPGEREPGLLVWAIASVSLVLPWLGILAGMVGIARISQGLDWGWVLVALALAMIVLDVLIDFVWAHPSVSASDEPDLNRRGSQLIGRVALVAEPFVSGRGKVRIGDTLWPAEGPELPVGTSVAVIAFDGLVLRVESHGRTG